MTKLTTCLLDNGAQLNFMTPDYAVKQGFQIFTLERLAQEIGGEVPPIHGIGGIKVKPLGFVIMKVRIPCIWGYNEDQIAIVLDDPSMKQCPVILGDSYTLLGNSGYQGEQNYSASHTLGYLSSLLPHSRLTSPSRDRR